jgi:hypothetical protein
MRRVFMAGSLAATALRKLGTAVELLQRDLVDPFLHGNGNNLLTSALDFTADSYCPLAAELFGGINFVCISGGL